MDNNKKDIFPSAELADENGIVASGGDCRPELLLEAYSKGIFPWPHKGYPLLWFSPDPRGVIFSKNRKCSKSLTKYIKKKDWQIKYNTSFAEVIRACQKSPRAGQQGTWINEELIRGYAELFKLGYAYSVEAWKKSEMVAGIYGVSLKGFYSAESMFYKESNASKALLYLFLERLENMGVDFLDIQMLTDVSKALGGEEISRAKFLDLLEASLKIKKAPNLGS